MILTVEEMDNYAGACARIAAEAAGLAHENSGSVDIPGHYTQREARESAYKDTYIKAFIYIKAISQTQEVAS